MKKIFIVSLLLSSSLFATPSEMQSLLLQAKQSHINSSAVNEQRELRFKKALKERKKLLLEAKKELKALKEESLKLNDLIDVNEKKLTLLEDKLHQRSGNLGELYGVVKQYASDLFAEFTLSATTALRPERLTFLKTLSDSKRLPNTQTLSKLWYEILQELHLSSLVQNVNLDVVTSEGKVKNEAILFLGPFNQSSREDIYTYNSVSKQLQALSTSPSDVLSVQADAGEEKSGMVDTYIDPTRGTLLSLSTQTPQLSERIAQGSTVGYVIIFLGLIGIGLAVYRGIKIFLIELSIKKEDDLSPLVQLHSFYNKHKQTDRDSLEMLFEQQLSRTQSDVEQGLPIIKLLAAVAPLMGLLGTVTGMIATFSAITLFGTGDPKLMAGGISQALITTVEGLIIAIPLLFSFTLLNNRAKAIVAKLNEEALLLLAKHT